MSKQLRDLGALRDLVPRVLAAEGVALPPRGQRTACPICCGSNQTEFSFNERVYHCFRCGAGGDVFDLVMRLRGCDFPTAVATVAQMGGVPVEGLPRIDGSESERRARIARRRRALHRWRNHRLMELIDGIRELTRDAEWIGQELCSARARGSQWAEDLFWQHLERVHWDLAVAEWLAAQLEREDEREWARLWLAARSAKAGEEAVGCKKAA